MKKAAIRWIFVLPMLLTVASCTDGAGQEAWHDPQPSDTLYTEERAMGIYGREPERALAIIDSAELVGNLSDFRADLCRAKVYGRSMELQRPDTAQAICEALLDHDSVKASTDLQMEVIDQLINVCRLRQDNEQWLRWATMYADLCHERAMTMPERTKRDLAETEALRAEAEIGVVMAHLGQSGEGLERLNHIILRLDHPGSLNRLDALIITLKRKINVLKEHNHFAEVIPVATRMLERLENFTTHPADYAEDSNRLSPNPDDLACYIDFYRAQAHIFLAEAYEKLGNRKMARDHMALFEQSDFSNTYGGRCLAAMVRVELGEYDKALDSFAEQERQMKGDTICEDYAIILLGRAKIAERQGHLAAALDYRNRYEVLSDTLCNQLLASKAHDYAVRYQLKEQRMEAERLQTRTERNRLYNIAISIAFLVVLAAIVWFWWQQRVIGSKNRSLVQHISEAIKYKKLYEKSTPRQADEPTETAAAGDAEMSVEDIPPSQVGADRVSPDLLFDRIRRIVQREQLYLNPAFDRQAVIEYFHLPKNRVGQAFTQGSEYNSLSDFIRDCRLEHACELLGTTDMTVSEIATASGFSRITTFNHDFKAKYNMAPTIYRKQLRQ